MGDRVLSKERMIVRYSEIVRRNVTVKIRFTKSEDVRRVLSEIALDRRKVLS